MYLPVFVSRLWQWMCVPPPLLATVVLYMELSLTFSFHITLAESLSATSFSVPSFVSLPPSPVFPFPFLLLHCSVRSNSTSSQIWSLCFLFHLPHGPRWPSDASKLSNEGRVGGVGDMEGGGRIEGTHNCFLREAFSPAFVPLGRSTLTFLSHHACLRVPLDPLVSLPLSTFSDGGPNNNSTQPCIVFSWKPPRLHKQLTHSVVFFWAHFSPIFWSAPSLAHLARGFMEPRPPAGIREDNSRAFRWVFHWLLLPRSSRNIIGTVHFVPASLLCHVVTQFHLSLHLLFLFMSWGLPLLCDCSPIHTLYSQSDQFFFSSLAFL